MNESDKDEEVLKKKIKFFYDKSIAIHLDLRNGKFYNGYIQEIYADFFEISDRKLGLVPIFFNEIKVLEPFKKEEKHE